MVGEEDKLSCNSLEIGKFSGESSRNFFKNPVAEEFSVPVSCKKSELNDAVRRGKRRIFHWTASERACQAFVEQGVFLERVFFLRFKMSAAGCGEGFDCLAEC